jgi:hypothetical protein
MAEEIRHHERPEVRVIRALRPGWLLPAVAALAAAACGVLVQGVMAGDETARLNSRFAGLLSRNVHPDAVSKAVSISNLAEPPGLWFMVAMAVMFLYVKRRGGSTARIAAAAGLSLAIAACVNATLPGGGKYHLVSLSTAVVVALAFTTMLLARRWLDPRRAVIAMAGIAAAATGTGLALAIAGQPLTVLAAGAFLGTAVTGTVEGVARLRWGRWLSDQPGRSPGTASSA